MQVKTRQDKTTFMRQDASADRPKGCKHSAILAKPSVDQTIFKNVASKIFFSPGWIALWHSCMRAGAPLCNPQYHDLCSSLNQGNKKVTWKKLRRKKKKLFFFVFSKNFGWGALPPRPPGFWLGGQSPPRPPLNGRSSHLIEAAKRGRLDQMIFFRRR